MEQTSSVAALAGLVEVLGGRSVFRKPLTSEAALISIIRDGLPYKSFASLMKALELTPDFATPFLGINKRTLQRRQQKEKLEALESDRVVRLAQVFVKSRDVFGDKSSALEWLRTSNVNLGGHKPLDCLDTEIGERQVMDLLSRIEYGVYS
jgi:putative toxin-antitoxin system antitoxin component (TIGR02293 family)